MNGERLSITSLKGPFSILIAGERRVGTAARFLVFFSFSFLVCNRFLFFVVSVCLFGFYNVNLRRIAENVRDGKKEMNNTQIKLKGERNETKTNY